MADQLYRPRLSVIVPSYDQAAFLPRALSSLVAQDFSDWEAIAVDDGSTDETPALLAAWARTESRLKLIRHPSNLGLGAALNTGLRAAQGDLIAYLPSDDHYFGGHLTSLISALEAAPHARLAVSGLRHHYSKLAPGRIEGEPIQLVQALHCAGPERWVERTELTTDDLDAMFWDQFGPPVESGQITAEWVDHPLQRHKAIRSPDGGVNPYRQRYRVREPLNFRSTTGLAIDERARFAPFRATSYPRAKDGLKILLVGELAYNPERVLALAERGNTLFGLWTDTPCWFNWVGPQPFGHVEDLPADDWQNALRRVRPDVIYALLNWQTIAFAHRILRDNPGVPFVWHFKEGPFIAIEKGLWPRLLDLYLEADGRVYSSAEMRDWFALADPRLAGGGAPELVLDGDLPKADVLREAPTPRLSDADGEIHTVVPGRPIGLHPETVAELAANGVHLHFYGDFIHDMWRAWIARTQSLAGRFLHIHSTVHQEQWVEEFSRYDAGWLHFFQSKNQGDLRRADWDDLNLPARMATLGVCGLPMLQRDNSGHIVATQTLARERGLGFFFQDMAGLAGQLRDRRAVDAVRGNVWAQRRDFTFDAQADALVALLRAAIRARAARVTVAAE